jgi:hypothetical protein
VNMKVHSYLLAALALGTCTGAALRAAPKVQFDSESLDFGNVQSGSPINASFQFKNAGDAELEIVNVHPGCGCTKAEAKKTKLAPGESSTIDAVFNSTGYNGPISKSVSVTTNDPARQSLALLIKATISMGALVKPSTLSFDNLRVNGSKTFTLTVTPLDPKTFAITEVVPVGSHITVPGFRKVETRTGAYWEIFVVLKAGKVPGRVMETLRMVTNTPNHEVLTATVFGNVIQ